MQQRDLCARRGLRDLQVRDRSVRVCGSVRGSGATGVRQRRSHLRLRVPPASRRLSRPHRPPRRAQRPLWYTN